ncbi:NAD(P)-dependent oxidoreductase [Frigidibacter sp. MR17.14]|uniref:NAD(P)-dependent oxidoreductase n=1 Tax=Frigidibacter sp. MR17.14 TaxID=3126509 RepID=UPI003012ECCA
MNRIGMVGIGLMGHGIAKNILGRGFALSFLDHPGNQPVDDLLAAGAARVDGVEALAADCDVLLLCVTGSPQVEEVLGRVLPVLRAGTFVIDCSTAIPASTEALAAKVAAAGGRFLDAAMTRTPKEAEEGRLNLLIGGAPEDLAVVEPLLAAFSENRFHAGGPGAGHRLKLLHNFVSLGTATLLAEAAASAAEGGIAPEVLVDCLKRGGGYGAALDRLSPFILTGDVSSMRFSNANGLKDIGYYRRMVADLGTRDDVARGVLAAYERLIEEGNGERLVPEQVALFRR